MAEDVADLVGAEPRVDGDENAAGGGDAVVRLEHRGDVRAEERDPVVLGEARQAAGPTPGDSPAPRIHGTCTGALRAATATLSETTYVQNASRRAGGAS